MIQVLLSLFVTMPLAALTAEPPMIVPGGAGSFDFMGIDAKNRLILAAHPKRSGFAVVDLNTGKVAEVDAVAVNGIAADSKGKFVFAAGPDKTLVKYNSATWEKVGSLSFDGPCDCVQYDSKSGLVYVDNDDGTRLWVVDPKDMKVVDTITIKEAPEYMVVDTKRKRIFQAIKSTSSVQVIDTESHKVLSEWALGEVSSPHGLAEDRKAGKIIVAGKNGKLVVLNAENGTIQARVDVTKNSDQIAYDSALHRVYVPGSGVMQVIQIDDSGAKVVDSVAIPNGCHSVVVDPTTHDVWVAYADAQNSYVMRFKAAP